MMLTLKRSNFYNSVQFFVNEVQIVLSHSSEYQGYRLFQAVKTRGG